LSYTQGFFVPEVGWPEGVVVPRFSRISFQGQTKESEKPRKKICVSPLRELIACLTVITRFVLNSSRTFFKWATRQKKKERNIAVRFIRTSKEIDAIILVRVRELKTF
jgi:hypothetical protein